ncbi:hypothetical protein [Thioalkalivibrio sp. XN279]|uniref:hypothetical protein n=1 Tax=Thioalkalivibrio sp. XN279 TaxID=2714953 RepID=UPI00140B4525|nr:hypothetical protein [Thioalkalivibrio sp. XN279]NHA14632.1 hypothetical protein [Thioalkalivibrio sp. XN279]
MTELQMGLLARALKELDPAGARTDEIRFAYNGIISATPALLADLLLLMQGRFTHWYKRANDGKGPSRGTTQSMTNLVGKLLPHTQEQVIAFRRSPPKAYSRDGGPILLLRLTADVQQRLASMAKLARDFELSHVSANLNRGAHAWVVNYLESPFSDGRAQAKICVSRSSVWFDCRRDRSGYQVGEEERFETNKVKLADLMSVDLIPEPSPDKRLPTVVSYTSGHLVEKRLNALCRAEQVLSIMSDALGHVVDAVPADEVALFERIWAGANGPGPITQAKEAWRNLEDELENWRAGIEAEQESICRQLLGVSPGDIVVTEQQGRTVRIRVTHAHVVMDEDRASFLLYGTRYRRDGVLGKRTDSISIPIYSEDRNPNRRSEATQSYSPAYYYFRGRAR